MPTIRANYSVYKDRTTIFPNLAVPQDKELFYYATSAGHETLGDDYVMERHDINIYMINYIVGGHGKLVTDGREIELESGDLTFLHLVNHSTLSVSADPTEILYFHVLGAQTEAIYNKFLQQGDFVIHNVPQKLLTDSFSAFSNAMTAEDKFYEQSKILYSLLMEILKLRNSEAHNKYPKLIDTALCEILYNCPPPSPKEIAERFGFSPIYMERLFKKHVGESMQSYILKQKYHFACRYLADTDMSVQEIAQKVGYSDSKGLNALFAKFGKLTPLAYRKHVRK